MPCRGFVWIGLVVSCLSLGAISHAHAANYHLHNESSSTSSYLALKSSPPDRAAVSRSWSIATSASGDRLLGRWDTPIGVPGAAGVLLQGQDIIFTLWMRKTANVATMFPRVVLTQNAYAHNTERVLGLCEATGASALTTTWTAYTLVCTTPLTVAFTGADRFTLDTSVLITNRGKGKVSVLIGLEGTADSTYDSRVEVPNPGALPPLNCPEANPNDTLPDDVALNACLNRPGTLNRGVTTVLATQAPGQPGYIIATGLVLWRSGATLTSATWDTLLVAAPGLTGLTEPMLRVDGWPSDYTISNLTFDGNRLARGNRADCAGDYDPRTGGYNLMLRGTNFLIEGLRLRNTLCGTAMEVGAEIFTIRGNLIRDNGFQESEDVSGGWADGITLGLCISGLVYHNTLVDNTDVDLIIGPSNNTFCRVAANTISHLTRYAFAALMVGFPGDHRGVVATGNTVTSALNQLAFGIMVGHHPWIPGDLDFFEVLGPDIVSNTSSGAVVPLAVDGVSDGFVSGNSATGARGTDGFAYCTLSANYTVADITNATSVQSGSIPRTYHFGGCW